MKQGTTTTLSFNFKLKAIEVTDIIFRFKRNKKDKDELLKKELSKNEAYFEDGAVKLPLNQEDTLALTKVFWIEAQIIFSNRSTIKSTNKRYKMDDTLGTTTVENSQSDGNEETIDLDFNEYVVGPSDYEKIKNHPYIEGEEVVGHKTAHDYGLAKESDLGDTNEAVAAVGRKANQNATAIEELNRNKQNKISVNGHLQLDGDTVINTANKVQPNMYDHVSDYDDFEDGDIYIGIENTTGSIKVFKGKIIGNQIRWTPTSNSRCHASYNDAPTTETTQVKIGDFWLKLSGHFMNPKVESFQFASGVAYGGIIWIPLTIPSDFNNYYNKSQVDNFVLSLSDNLSVSLDPNTYIATFTLKHGNSVLSEASIDLPLETLVSDFDYDASTKELIIILKNGNTRRVDVSSIVNGLVSTDTFNAAVEGLQNSINGKQDKIDASHKISSDHVNDANANNKFVTDTEKNRWDAKQDAINGNNKLDADNVEDTNSTNKFVTQAEKNAWDAKQDAINPTHKLDSSNVDDSNSNNKFVTPTEKQGWNGKQDALTESDTVHIDGSGNITASEPKFNLIKSIDLSQLSEPVAMIIVSQDEDGDPFAYDDILVELVSGKTSADNSKYAIETYTGNQNVSNLAFANYLSTTAKNYFAKFDRINDKTFNYFLGGNNQQWRSQRRNITYANKIDKVVVYTDSTFTEGTLIISGRNKF